MRGREDEITDMYVHVHTYMRLYQCCRRHGSHSDYGHPLIAQFMR